MYTQSRFFDPEILSYKPLKYPNITYMQGQTQMQQNPSFGNIGNIASTRNLKQNSSQVSMN